MDLQCLGADIALFKSFESYAAQGLSLARVAASTRGRYTLFTESGECVGEASGSLWYQTVDPAAMPATGDWVAVRVVDREYAIVEAVLPRRTLFSRKVAGQRQQQQPIAANIDIAFLVCGLDRDFNLHRIERYLTLTAEANVEAVIVLNKADLCSDVGEFIDEVIAIAPGIGVVPASVRCSGGLDRLRTFLRPGRTIALLGSSGVGKSSIINALLGEERIRTHEVRQSDGRGQHTTTRRELIPLEVGGALIDTPGMRELQLWAGQDSVDRAFDDITEIATGCRFRDCTHSGEKDCAVARAIAKGLLDSDRLQSYRKLTAEVVRHQNLTDHVSAAKDKKRLKALHRAAREIYRLKDRERRY